MRRAWARRRRKPLTGRHHFMVGLENYLPLMRALARHFQDMIWAFGSCARFRLLTACCFAAASWPDWGWLRRWRLIFAFLAAFHFLGPAQLVAAPVGRTTGAQTGPSA